MGATKTKTKSSSTTNQTQTAAPPTWTQPGLEAVSGAVTGAVNQIPDQHYSGPMVASMSPAQLAAIQGAWTNTAQQAQEGQAWLQQFGMPLLEQGMEFTTALPSTDYQLADREDLTGVINASIDPVMRQLQNNILPGLTMSALDSGAYSGDRAMRVMPTEAIRQANESMQRIASQLGYEDYQNYENRRLQAYGMETAAAQQNYALESQRQSAMAADRLQRLGMAPEYINSMLKMGASSGDLLNMAAQLEVQNNQLGYNNSLEMDKYASYSPFMGLDQASQLLTQLSGGWGTQTMNGQTNSTQTTSTKQPLAQQLIQGAIGIGSMVAGFPGGAGMISGALGLGGAAGTPAASSLFQGITGVGT